MTNTFVNPRTNASCGPDFRQHPAQSPLLNLGDGNWNPGEDPILGPDQGGIRSMVLGSGATAQVPQLGVHVHKFNSPIAWIQTPVTTGPSGPDVWVFTGYLRPQPQSGNIDDAAFQIVCSTVFDPARDTRIVIDAPPTTAVNVGDSRTCQGDEPDRGRRFAYPGYASDDGLRPGVVNPQLIQRNGLRAGPDVQNLITAHIVPRLWGRPATFHMQANVLLVRAIRAMFASSDASWRPANWPQLTAFVPAITFGASFGGALADWQTLLFPEDFQGGIYSGAVLSLRRYVSEEESLRYLMALSGFGQSAKDFNREDALHYHLALTQAAQMHGIAPANWSPFYHGSPLTAWRDGWLQHSMFALQADEDFATTGSDWIPMLSGQREFTPSGIATNSAGVSLLWSWFEKRCHGDFPPPPIQNPIYPGQTHQDHLEFILDYAEWLHANGLAVARPFVAPAPGSAGAAGEMDVYDHAFMQAPPGPPTSGVLQLSDFVGTPTASGSLGATVPAAARRPGKSFGSGTYLGLADSLIVGVPHEQDPNGYTGLHEVCVGSADGVVTRFAVDPQTLEFVPQAMSPALGYGAWALAFGEADGLPGKELIVGTHRGLHALYREDLSVMASNPALPWEQSRPLRMATMQVKATDRAQVVFASDIGMLALYDVDTLSPGSQPLATYFEPGILDLAVLPSTGLDKADIAILSERGHVVKVHWELAGPPAMTLVAVSPRLNGFPVDMELAEVDSTHEGPELVVLLRQTIENDFEAIWVLDSNDLSVVNASFTQRTDTVPIATASSGGAYDLEVWQPSVGPARFVVLREDRLFVIPYATATTGSEPQDPPIELCAFPPMLRALDIALANVVDDPNATEPMELVIATEAGYVTWIPTDDLLNLNTLPSHAGGRLLSFGSVPARFPNGDPDAATPSPNSSPQHCNRTLAATWGMTVHPTHSPPTLEVIDQSGSRSSIDGIGNVTLVEETGFGFLSAPTFLQVAPQGGPIRDLAFLGPITPFAPLSGAALRAAADPSAGGTPLYPGMKTSACQMVLTTPMWPGASTQNIGGGQWIASPDVLTVNDGFAKLPRTGDALTLGSGGTVTRHICWWSGEEHRNVFGNRISGFTQTALGQTTWWSTTAPLSAGSYSPAPVTWGPTTMHGHDLRAHHFEPMADRQAEALRLFTDPGDPTQVRIAAFTPGARLIVLAPGISPTDIGPAPIEKDATTAKAIDLGTGGMALAVGPVLPAGNRALYVGSMSCFSDNANFIQANGQPDDQVSAIAMVRFQSTGQFGSATLTKFPELVLDGSSSLAPKVFGVCGMAVGDIVPSVSGPELVVGSLDGHLLVYGLDPVTGEIVSQPPLYQTRVEGSVGAYNSIVIADLVNAAGSTLAPGTDGVNELYAAGSLGLRRWMLP